MWAKSIEQEADDLLAWVHKRKYMAQSKYIAAKARVQAVADRERREGARKRLEQRIRKELSIHNICCPKCGGNTFASELIMDNSDFSWYYRGYPGGEYRGNLHLGEYRQYGLRYGILNHVVLKVQTCICGHEWVELPKKKEVG